MNPHLFCILGAVVALTSFSSVCASKHTTKPSSVQRKRSRASHKIHHTSYTSLGDKRDHSSKSHRNQQSKGAHKRTKTRREATKTPISSRITGETLINEAANFYNHNPQYSSAKNGEANLGAKTWTAGVNPRFNGMTFNDAKVGPSCLIASISENSDKVATYQAGAPWAPSKQESWPPRKQFDLHRSRIL